MILDFRTNTDKEIEEALIKFANKEIDYLRINSIYPVYFVDKYGAYYDDINGFDWWGHIFVNLNEIPIFGNTWYGYVEFECED